MQNIIKKELSPIKVIKASEYKTICSATDFLQKTKLECEQMRHDAKVEIEKFKSDWLTGIELRVQAENAVFLNETIARFEQKLKKIEDSIFAIFKNLLEKTGIKNISGHQLAALIEPEISSLANNSPVIIEANLTTVDKFKEAFPIEINLSYKINNDFKDNDCVCDTGLYFIKLDLSNAIKIITSTLQV